MKEFNRNILNKISLFKGRQSLVWLLLFIGFLGLTALPANAQVLGIDFSEMAKDLVSWVVNLYIYVVGAFLTSVLLPVLIGVAQYNSFIDNEVVRIGWVLTRDLANMLFIVVFMIIAFSTMLKIQTYHFKQTLVKFIMMAILINFSRLICGVLIDFFQILMLTFVRGFQGALAGNFIQAFRIYEMLSVASGVGAGGQQITPDLSTNLTIIGGLILAAVGLTVVALTVMIMIIVLISRIIMLWLLVILAPMAYFANTIRPNYWSQWWGEFFKQLMTGPIIAFFLWLQLKVAQNLGTGSLINVQGSSGDVPLGSGFAVPETFVNYLTMVALMIGGLIISQKMAAQTGGVVGSMANKVAKGQAFVSAARMGRKTVRAGGKVGKVGLSAAGLVGGGLMNQWAARSARGQTKIDRFAKRTKGWVNNIGSYQPKSTGGKVVKGIANVATLGALPAIQAASRATHKNVGNRTRALSEKAAERIAPEKGNRKFLERVGNKFSMTATGVAAQQEAVKLKPTVLGPAKLKKFLSGAGKDDLQNINKNEWKAIGTMVQSGQVDPTNTEHWNSEIDDHLQTNRVAQGSFNTGLIEQNLIDKKVSGDAARAQAPGIMDKWQKNARTSGGQVSDIAKSDGIRHFVSGLANRGHDPGTVNRTQVIATDKSGNVKMDNSGNPILSDKFMTVDDEKRDQEQGAGNISAHAFGRGTSNVVGSSFDKAKLAFLSEEGDEYKHKAGANLSDQNEIQRYASRMSGEKLNWDAYNSISTDIGKHEDSINEIDNKSTNLKNNGGSKEDLQKLENEKQWHQSKIVDLKDERDHADKGGKGIIQMQVKGLEELSKLDKEISVKINKGSASNAEISKLQGLRESKAKEIGAVGNSGDPLSETAVSTRLKNTKAAQKRFSQIAKGKHKVDDLSLVNTSAAGYDRDQLVEAYDHEQMHALGIKDDETVAKATDAMKQDHTLRRNKARLAENIIVGESTGSSADQVIASMSKSNNLPDTKTTAAKLPAETNQKVKDSTTAPKPNSQNELDKQASRTEELLDEVVGKLGDVDTTLGDISNSLKKGSAMGKAAGINHVRESLGGGGDYRTRLSMENVGQEIKLGRLAQQTASKKIESAVSGVKDTNNKKKAE